MTRMILDPVGFMRPGGLGAVRAALTIARIVHVEGAQVVSIDTDGSIYCTPTGNPFSEQLLAKYSDQVVGSYNEEVGAQDIRDDLLTQWDQDRAA